MIHPSFIGIYNNSLSKGECSILISLFEQSKEKLPGKVIDFNDKLILDTHIKKSLELNPSFTDGSIISQVIKKSLTPCIEKYKKKYSGIESALSGWKVDDSFTFKKFENEDEGFKMWHTEHGPGSCSSRILVWSFYLNNAQSGTDFMYFPTVRARMGRCVIWPASFTHIHRSSPNKGLKYYISGWIHYNEK